MIAITRDRLDLHRLWAEGHPDGVRLVANGADLRGADLRNADLRGADLLGADLRGADLRGAILANACLRGADLRGADFCDAILNGAIFTDANLNSANLNNAILADLRGADLRGADLRGAILVNADFRGAKGLDIASDVPARLLAVARAALQPGALEMKDWHSCNTVHCMSGWATHQAGEVGRLLEQTVGNHMAGLMLLGPEAALHFYDSNEQAREYLQGVIDAAENQEVQG